MSNFLIHSNNSTYNQAICFGAREDHSSLVYTEQSLQRPSIDIFSGKIQKTENNPSSKTKKSKQNLTPLEKRKKKIKKIIYTTIGSTFLLTLGCSYLFRMGHGSWLRNKLQELNTKSKSLINETGNNKQGIKAKIIDKADKAAKICSNFTSFKDILCEKIMNLTKIGQKVQQKITSLYSKINKNAVNNTLKTTNKNREKFIEAVEKAIAEAKKDTKISPKKIKELEELLIKEKKHGGKEFLSKENFNKICSIMDKDMEYLKDNISLKTLLSKKSLNGFVAEDILSERRNKFIAPISTQKEHISSTFKNTKNYLEKRLIKTDSQIYSLEDKKLASKLGSISNKLHKNIKNYAKSTPKTARQNLSAVQSSLNELSQGIQSLPPNSTIRKNITIQITEYENILKNNNGGNIEQMRNLVASMFGTGSAIDNAVSKSGRKYSHSLNNSLDKMINMFDKERDNVLGAGTTDILGLLMPAGAFIWTLSKKKEKDEKRGATLEYGIPLLGSYTVYIYGLANQLNGFKSLALSAVSGLILNKIGSSVNKFYQKNKQENITSPTLTQTTSQKKEEIPA